MLRSCRICPGAPPSWFNFRSTLTTTLTGLRRPTRQSSPRPSDIVALKHPVLRCFGSMLSIRLMLSRYPSSSTRSASSSTSISSSLTLQTDRICVAGSAVVLPFFFPLAASEEEPRRNSSSLPGVPTMMSQPVLRNESISCFKVVLPPTRRRAGRSRCWVLVLPCSSIAAV